ncbi:hypothetical protein SARC_12973 [Sphaeroforma arctica JP610]|uniref:Uncharacterized protein n=1 Tax=Sphaeroforma arctica JP610 TaxID=667725 RepID=A0A0L0FCI1_9EUKA|nr:hypothetical protein SARC_12973 [Sphaeroforma arctica JP610]KNC74482.1 hypothetical protein SARC_12973 [Sphaeroforma arctica JP610]|eukprot:XP_014148384.1 hypothetical protein SARC_12973 [Sphaeroforma arctica JP610]
MAFLARRTWSKNSMAGQLDRLRDAVIKLESTMRSPTYESVEERVDQRMISSLLLYIDLRRAIVHMLYALLVRQASLSLGLCEQLLGNMDLVTEAEHAEAELDPIFILADARGDIGLLSALLRAYIHIELYRLPESTIVLNEAAKYDLHPSQSNLHGWFNTLREALVAKYTLYFCRHLTHALYDSSFRAIRARRRRDYLALVHKLIKKTDCLNFSLIYVTHATPHAIVTTGFSLSPLTTPPTGMAAYPIVFSYPQMMPLKYRTNAIITLMERFPRLTAYRGQGVMGSASQVNTGILPGTNVSSTGGSGVVSALGNAPSAMDWRRSNSVTAGINSPRSRTQATAPHTTGTGKDKATLEQQMGTKALGGVAGKDSFAPVEFFRDDTNVCSSYYFCMAGDNVVMMLISGTGRSSEDTAVTEQLRSFSGMLHYKDIV